MHPTLDTPRPHILIVSSDASELRNLIETLRYKEYRLSIVKDGGQGYNRALASMPDLALLDAGGRSMRGCTVTRMLKAHPLTSYIPVFLILSAASAQDRLEGLRAGAVDFISPPYEVDEIAERIRIHVQLGRLCRMAARDHEDESVVSEDETLVSSARLVLEGCLADPPESEELAEMLGVGERRLLQALRRCLGASYPQFLRIERVLKAQSLLSKTSLKVSEIAYELGFSGGANFSTAFKKRVGMTPVAYRRINGR